ncbi:MAG: hypothetical protein AB1643_01665 [Patescibacteria group bacterium]
METNAKRDLIWLIVFLVALFFLWYFTGGPNRESAKSSLFLKSPQKQAEKNVQEAVNFSSIPQKPDNNSPYRSKITIISSQEAKKQNPDEEYLTIQASYNNPEPINIKQWSLGKSATEHYYIGSAMEFFKMPPENSRQDIFLKPGDRAIITTGKSPVSRGFKLNKCIGYLEQMQDFIPMIPLNCPHPINDEYLPASLDDLCIDYINSNFKICTQYLSYLSSLSNSCKQYINERINYKGCSQWHRNDNDFYKPGWRLFLNQTSEIWPNINGTVILYDENNKIVDSINY